MATTIDLLKNSSFETKLDSLISAVGGGESNVTFQVTLAASSWSNSAQTVSNANFKASGCAYTIAPAYSSFSNWSDAQIVAEDVATDGQMIFHCGTTPTSDIICNILKVGV